MSITAPRHLHKARTDTVIRLEASDLNPGHVVLSIEADGLMFTKDMSPEEWVTFLQATANIAIEAHGRLLAACKEENNVDPNLN